MIITKRKVSTLIKGIGQYSVRNDLCLSDHDVDLKLIWAKLGNGEGWKILLGIIYKPPNCMQD